jgi:hypothetical protein
MIYTKKQFGIELKSRIHRGNDYNEISKWAFTIYINYGLLLEKDLDYFVLKLMAMEEGYEFILSKEELLILADKLINENNHTYGQSGEHGDGDGVYHRI